MKQKRSWRSVGQKVSPEIVWGIVKNRHRYLYKQKGNNAKFSVEPGNKGRHSYHRSGYVADARVHVGRRLVGGQYDLSVLNLGTDMAWRKLVMERLKRAGPLADELYQALHRKESSGCVQLVTDNVDDQHTLFQDLVSNSTANQPLRIEKAARYSVSIKGDSPGTGVDLNADKFACDNWTNTGTVREVHFLTFRDTSDHALSPLFTTDADDVVKINAVAAEITTAYNALPVGERLV